MSEQKLKACNPQPAEGVVEAKKHGCMMNRLISSLEKAYAEIAKLKSERDELEKALELAKPGTVHNYPECNCSWHKWLRKAVSKMGPKETTDSERIFNSCSLTACEGKLAEIRNDNLRKQNKAQAEKIAELEEALRAKDSPCAGCHNEGYKGCNCPLKIKFDRKAVSNE